MNLVTDTHSLVWYFTEDPRLSKKAFDAFEGTIESGTVIVPAVVLAEIMFIAKKGRVTRYSQAFCVNSLSTGKLGLTFPIRFDLQLNSIFKEINARSL